VPAQQQIFSPGAVAAAQIVAFLLFQLLQYHMVRTRDFVSAVEDATTAQLMTLEGVLVPTALTGAAPLRVRTDSAISEDVIGPSDGPSAEAVLQQQAEMQGGDSCWQGQHFYC
jgi:hypothetical protein